jgi:uncharacterized membrane protein
MLLVAACQPQSDGGAASSAPDAERPYSGIAENETLRFTGTEPFWGGQVTASSLTYTTPDNQKGEVIPVERFAGRGGVSFTGMRDGKEFVMMATPLTCSDGMSDRSYPFTVTLRIGEETRDGCGWTERKPFQGPEHP